MFALLITYNIRHCLCQVHQGPDAMRDSHPHHRQTHSQTTPSSHKRNLLPTSWPFLVLEATGKDTFASSRTLFFTSSATAPHTKFPAWRLLTIPSIRLLQLLCVNQLGLPTLPSAKRGMQTSLSAQSHATNSWQSSMMCITPNSMTPPKVSMQYPFTTSSLRFTAHTPQFPNLTLMTTWPNLSLASNHPSHLLSTHANRRSVRRLPKTPVF
jgi:hypothetical protein